jgi:hypothetical protein
VCQVSQKKPQKTETGYIFAFSRRIKTAVAKAERREEAFAAAPVRYLN